MASSHSATNSTKTSAATAAMLSSPVDPSLMLNSILCNGEQNQPGEHANAAASSVTLNWKNVWDYFYQTVRSDLYGKETPLISCFIIGINVSNLCHTWN